MSAILNLQRTPAETEPTEVISWSISSCDSNSCH